MLKMKSQCETCNTGVGHKELAYICSYECTFCEACTEQTHQFVCPNCDGELVKRPTRKSSPASVVTKQLKRKIKGVFS